MSAKQLRKLEERLANEKGNAGNDSDGDNTSAEESPREQKKTGVFGMMMGSSDGSDSEGPDEEGAADPDAARAEPEPEREAASVAKGKKGKQKKKKKGKQKGKADASETPQAEVDSDEELLVTAAAEAAAAAAEEALREAEEPKAVPLPLVMIKADFSADRERKRLFGDNLPAPGPRPQSLAVKARGRHEGKFIHYRRLFIIEPLPDEGWPRPWGQCEMYPVTLEDGCPAFGLRTNQAHQVARAELLEAQLSLEPREVHDLVVAQPFCVEGLIIFADLCRVGGEYDLSYRVVRQAMYAVECSFDGGFSPFHDSGAGALPKWPRVRIAIPRDNNPRWPGWLWLAAFREYMLGVYSQGLHRTAIEVCKLLLAMTLPRDPMHMLVYLDVLCLRAKQFGLVRVFATSLLSPELVGEGRTLNLACMLPNFAYSSALAAQLELSETPDLAALNRVTVASILPSAVGAPAPGPDDEDAACAPHAALMRALLIFPQALCPILEKAGVKLGNPPPAGSPCKLTWEELIKCRPFFKFSEFRHEKFFLSLAHMADAYAHLAGALWRGDALLRWLHACAGRLVQMSESSLFDAELTEARNEWRRSRFGLEHALSEDYGYPDFSVSEVREGRLPAVCLKSLDADFVEADAELRRNEIGVPPPTPTFDMLPRVAIPEVSEEAQLERALELSQMEEESRQRRRLVEEQDGEFLESLLYDQARQRGTDELVDRGFEREAARAALEQADNDVARALALLTSGEGGAVESN